MNKLSKRLQMVASLVPNGSICADIGADHGYLISELFLNKIILKGYACENKNGPFLRLKTNIESLKLDNDIIVELSDGIRNLPTDINTVIIAGMGGDTVCQIISESPQKIEQIDYFVISSHTKMEDVRKLLSKIGYCIISEDACYDSNQYYEVSLFKKGKANYSELELKYGPLLIKNRVRATLTNLKNRIEFNNKLINDINLPKKRIEELLLENKELTNVIKKLNAR